MSAVYVHIPWCEQKCPYCDFNSHVRAQQPESDYIDALINDLSADADYINNPVETVFFGGGTPSLFSPTSIGQILEGIDRHIGFAHDPEITLEANPGSAEQSKFEGFRAAGVNRLSIGIQSFNDPHLRVLGRIHDSANAVSAIKQAQDAGFERINLDLMHGLPEQSVEQALSDLRQALSMGCEHLSWYQLTLEPNTAFYKHPPPLPAEDTLADIQEAGQALLHQAGFNSYEVSAWSQPGRECRHNLNYWRFGDYLGIGAGAHGKLTHQGQVLRSQKTRMPESYLAQYSKAGAPPVFKPVAPDQLPFEFMLNQLRLRQGCDQAHFEDATGLDIAVIEAGLAQARSRGLMHPERLQVTDLGWRYLNDVVGFFL